MFKIKNKIWPLLKEGKVILMNYFKANLLTQTLNHLHILKYSILQS